MNTMTTNIKANNTGYMSKIPVNAAPMPAADGSTDVGSDGSYAEMLENRPPKMTVMNTRKSTTSDTMARAENPSHGPMLALTRLKAVDNGCVMLNGAGPENTGDVGGSSPPGWATPTPGSPKFCWENWPWPA